VKVTVLPIKWSAVVKSYVFIDVIKGNRKTPTNAELIKRIICEEFFIIALGAVILEEESMSN
jgi:hypothetical protein